MITINLLTTQDKKEMSKHYLILLSKDIVFSLLLLTALVGTVFLICHFILMKNFIQISQGAFSMMQGNETMTQEIRKTNQDLKKIEEIQEKNINWAETLLTLSNLTPADDVQLTNLEINQPKNLVTLQGKSLTREGFLILKKNLEESGCFENIKSPLSNLLLAKSLNFSLEMELKKSLSASAP